MERPRVRIRAAVVGMAAVLALGSSVLAGYEARPVAAADPMPPHLSMPIEADLATDAIRTLVDSPPVLPDVIDVDPIIDAANMDEAALPAESWEVAALAERLGTDPAAAFALVRDSIRFDAYPGVLRGAEGTLTARAGNAFDRALLLKALLDAQGHTARFAQGDLPPEVAGRLMTHVFNEPTTPLPDATGHTGAAAWLESVGSRARRDYALLQGALGGQAGQAESADLEAALSDLAPHAWVQIDQDGTWVDLDPSLPTALMGEPMTPATSTPDALPDDLRQTVTIRVIVESLTDGEVAEAVVLEQQLDAAAVADQQVLLYFGPDSGGGGGLLGGVGAPDVVIPVLGVDGTSMIGTGFMVEGEADGGFFGGSSQVDLTGVAIEIVTEAPGHEPVIARHLVLDRIPPAARQAGSVTREELAAVAGDISLPSQLSSVRHVLISTGGASPRASAIQRALAAYYAATDSTDPEMATATVDAVFWPTAIADQTLVTTSEFDILPGVDDEAVRAFVARPRVYVTSAGPDTADPAHISLVTDLLIDDVRMLAADPADTGAVAEHELWYGTLQAALETEQGLRSAVALDPESRLLDGVSLVMTRPLTVITADALESLPATAAPRIQAALEAGRTVVVPGDPATASTWWEIASDGTTRAILAPSLGGLRMKITGPRPPGIPPVRPPSSTPKQLPPKTPTTPKTPKVPRTPRRPPVTPEAPCTGNEQTVIRQCVALVTRFVIENVLLSVFLTLVTVGSLAVLGALAVGF